MDKNIMADGQIELIARMVMEAMGKQQDSQNGYLVPVGVSARHVHLTQEHVEVLFGEKRTDGRSVCIQ